MLNPLIRPLLGSPPGRQPVEVVERKGLGHPDTICDAIAEHICVRLCATYRDGSASSSITVSTRFSSSGCRTRGVRRRRESVNRLHLSPSTALYRE